MAEAFTTRQKIARLVGVIGLMAILPWYAVSGLVAPEWVVIILLAAWVMLLVVAAVLWRRRPALVLALPVAAAAIWIATVSAGGAWLGWTA